jgi:4-aminobutyrate aminotransferase
MSSSVAVNSETKNGLSRKEINQKQKEFIFPSVFNYYSEPLPMARGSMQHVWDVEGRQYLDFFGGIVTVSVGHCNPRVNSRMKEQIDTLQHVSTCFPTEPMVTLAEKLAQITPGSLKKSFLTNSGTEANETAVQAARTHTGNFEIIALRYGYSGRSSLARGLTGLNTWRRGTIEVGIVHAMNPNCYRCPLGLKYPDCNIACARDLEEVIQTSTSGKIAGFLAEPIQGVAASPPRPTGCTRPSGTCSRSTASCGSRTRCRRAGAEQETNGLGSSTGRWNRTSSPQPKAWQMDSRWD